MIQRSASETSGRRIREAWWNDRQVSYLAGRIIVKFKPLPKDSDQSAQSLSDAAAAEVGGRVARYPRPTGRALLTCDPQYDIVETCRRLAERGDVAYAEPDIVDRAQVVPNDTRYADQWSHPVVGSEGAWDLETGKANVLIGIIDSGISTTAAGALDHPDLDARGRYILGTDFVDGGAPRDLNGHGTHVAGIAAAESNNAEGVVGMNWGSRVYICRTLDTNGNGSSADFADAVEEIVDFAVANSVRAVINYSGGGAQNQTKEDACRYAQARGVLLCAAVGNDNGGPVIWPAAYSTTIDNVIAVGSTDQNDTVSSFSNVGPEVTVVAPGRDILSTKPTYAVAIPGALNYDRLDGTSMATPLVTGLVALMWSRHPGFTHARIRNCLTSTAVKLGTGTFDNAWGNGRVAAEAALRCGDLTFPTRFTRFTRFTIFTRFTRLTRFTRFTAFTRFTRLTRFTRFTVFTRFTRLTQFTRFTRFTRFPGVSRFLDPRLGPAGDRFIRVGRTVFALRETEIRRFTALQEAEADLSRIGVQYLHELASSERDRLAKALGYTSKDAAALIALAQRLLAALAEQP